MYLTVIYICCFDVRYKVFLGKISVVFISPQVFFLFLFSPFPFSFYAVIRLAYFPSHPFPSGRGPLYCFMKLSQFPVCSTPPSFVLPPPPPPTNATYQHQYHHLPTPRTNTTNTHQHHHHSPTPSSLTNTVSVVPLLHTVIIVTFIITIIIISLISPFPSATVIFHFSLPFIVFFPFAKEDDELHQECEMKYCTSLNRSR